ncbi:MAG: IclR family transcriptional regulator [Microbacterium sp.]|uniref:IclR family transcriptional regulator n=1 Tax=Microbacterium sp. TaxID=51671 RepID=UPI001AC111D2|nr:IclR family transcriptional regulator [Microbacterium sp.]MBN9177501.1 IclR family transcriptional regulator [Microbacterium sp.]
MERNKPGRVESVHRALVLLKLIVEEGSIGVTDAAAALDVNASTAQRLLATLAHDGFAVQGAGRRYFPGSAMMSPALRAPTPQLTDTLRPALEALFERTGETVHVATLVGTRIQHIDGIEATTHLLRFGLRVGVWLPAHITSGGKALLADLSDEEVEARYRLALTGPRGQRLDVDLDALREQLDDVRESRVAWNFEESEPGVAAMSISVGEVGGQRAALSIALPIARFTREVGDACSRALTDIADAVAARSLV